MYMYREKSGAANPDSSAAAWEAWRDGAGEARARWPKLEETSPRDVMLEEGEMLYIPPGWWHTVAGETPTVAVLLPFDMAAGETLHQSLMY